LGRPGVILDGESPPGLAARHRAARAVAARAERLALALAAHDEAARPHRAGDDAEVAEPRAHGALARDEHIAAEVMLGLDVVVVAVDRHLAELERRQPGGRVARRGDQR